MEIQRNHFYIRLLGPIQVEQNNKYVQGFESRKALALLGYLVTQNRPVSREKIINLFWGEKTENRGRGNLRRVLHNLNQLMPGCLRADRYVIQLEHSPICQCDLDIFSQLEEQSDLSTQTQAVNLYSGDFMEGLYLDDCPEFETWLATEQEYWRQRVVRLLDSLVTNHSQRGEYESALSFAQRLLSLTPWRESVHRQLMTLLARHGQRSAALRQYQLCQQMLIDEFGVEPTNETTALYQSIQSAETRTRFELPSPVTPFVGRKCELAEIGQLLASPDCRLLTITGLGGMGKTRLALRYAAMNQDTFLDGVAFIPLAVLDDPNRVVYAIAQSLELSISSTPNPKIQIFDYLRKKEMLLVLDNFEHLLKTAAFLSELLDNAPKVKLLVTSRERLNLRGEWIFTLDGLSIDSLTETNKSQQENQESPSEAVSLFIQQARQIDFHFMPDKHVSKICKLLDGFPLGIELAAALTSYIPTREILNQLQTNLAILDSTLQNVPARHRNLHIVFESSLNLLSEQEYTAFQNLTVFRGGFTLDAAQQVADINPQVLAGLVHKSLLRKDASNRYEIHTLLAQYSTEMRQQNPEADYKLHLAHSCYFTNFLFQRRQTYRGSIAIVNEITIEIENIRTAWEWAISHGETTLISQAADTLGSFYYIRCWNEPGEQAFRLASERLRADLQQEPESAQIMDALARVLTWLGEFICNQGDFIHSRRLMEEAVAIFRILGHTTEVAWSLLSLGNNLMQHSDTTLVEEYFEESLAIFEAIEEQNGIAICLEFMGTMKSMQGDYENAKTRYQKSLSLYRSVKDIYGEAGGLYCLGDIARITGDYTQAQKYFSESLVTYQSIENQRGAAQTYNQLGNIARLCGKYEQAREHHRQSLWLWEEIGERNGIATSTTNLGLDAFKQGDFSKSKTYCQKGLALFRETDHDRGIVFALINVGKACHALGEGLQAKEALWKAVDIAAEIQSIPQILEALVEIAHLLADAGNAELALRVIAHPLENQATYREVRKEAQETFVRLKADFPSDTIAQILAQEHDKELIVLLEEIASGKEFTI